MRAINACHLARPTRCVALLLALLLLAWPASSRAEDGWDGHILSLFWENDAVARSDRHYTQGAGFDYLTRDNAFPELLKRFSARLPALGLEVQAQKVGFGTAQEIYTPEDLDASEVVANDRPYAGWLYARFQLQRRGLGFSNRPALEIFGLDLGVIGPESLAEITQKKWHGIDPQGWDNQLEFEPGVVLHYRRLYLLSPHPARRGWGLHLVPDIHGTLGNVSTTLGLGATLQLGYNLPNPFSPCPTRTPLRYGFHLLAGVEGHLAARNIFLDGNSFRSSHSVDKIPAVGSFRVGVALTVKRVELAATYTLRTPEFQGQGDLDSFGSAAVTLKF